MKYHHYILALAVLPVLSSCGGEIFTFKTVTAGLVAASQGVFSRTDVNLKDKNYAAADFMTGQMNHKVSKNHVILAQPLEEVDHVGITSPLGSAIPEGIGLRLIELGYFVQLHEVAANGNAGLYPAPPKGQKADFVLKGTYAVGRKNVDVFLRIINVKSSQVVSRFDYAMPLSSEIKELAKTETRIFLAPD